MSANLFAKAAMGQRDAQAALVQHAMALEMPLRERLTLAEAFARLAAEHGLLGDQLVLAGALYLRAADLADEDQERAIVLLDEVNAIYDFIAEEGGADEVVFLAHALTQAADLGDVFAALSLDRLVAKLSPAAASAVTQFLNQETASQAAE